MNTFIYVSFVLLTFFGCNPELLNAQQQIDSQKFFFERRIITYGVQEKTSQQLFDVAEVGINVLVQKNGITKIHEYRNTDLRLWFGKKKNRLSEHTQKEITQVTWTLDDQYGLIPPNDGLANGFVPYLTEQPFARFLVPENKVDGTRTGVWRGMVQLQTKKWTPKFNGNWTYSAIKSGNHYRFSGPFCVKDSKGDINVSGSFERIINISDQSIVSSTGQLLTVIKPARYPLLDKSLTSKYRHKLKNLRKFDKILIHETVGMFRYAKGKKIPFKLTKKLREILEQNNITEPSDGG